MATPESNGQAPRVGPPQQWVAETFAQLEVPLVGYVRRLLHGNSEAARDVVQEAFVKLCQQGWPEIESHATAWLYRTCRNRAIDFQRREGRMSTTSSSSDVSVLHDRHGPPPEQLAEQGEQIEQVRARLDELPAQQQEILRLRLHDNLSYKQIAEVTGLTVSHVGYLLHQAISTLRAQIEA